MMAVIMTAVQNSSTVREMGMTTSAVNLIRSVGATIGTAIFALLISSKIADELLEHVSPFVYNNISHNSGVLDNLSIAMQHVNAGTATEIDYAILSEAQGILLAFANSVDFSFLCGMFIILLQVIIGIFFTVKPPVESDNEIYHDNTGTE
jgi:hypothetical protein